MIEAPEPLDEVQLLAVRMPNLIYPGLVIEADRVHDECVAFIPPNGIAPPGGIGILFCAWNGRMPEEAGLREGACLYIVARTCECAG